MPRNEWILRAATTVADTALYLAGGRRKHLRTRGEKGEIDLSYTVVGPRRGEPWVLLHGLGSIGAGWAPVIGRLRREARIVIPELSALGGTRTPDAALSMQDAARSLGHLIEKELGGRPATVAGLSLGGWMAVRLALARPDLVSRLALIDAGGYRHQDWETIESLVRVRDMEGVDRLYGALFAEVPWLMRLSREAFFKAYTSPSVRNMLDGLREDDAFDDGDLARLPMPTAVIWGEKDGLFTVETARAMAAALPDARLDVLPGCGHALHLECPRALADAFERFRRATASAVAGPRPARAAVPSTVER